MKDKIVFSTFEPDKSRANTLIIACHTIRKELEYAMKKTGVEFPVIYLKGSLHDIPKVLNETLQKLIDEAGENGVKRILLGYAACGNSVAGLKTGTCELIFPRTDDCITFFLGSMARRREMSTGTCYLTHGWLYEEGRGMAHYNEIMEKYGQELGKEIYEMLMEHYEYAGLVDTHCYEMDAIRKDACAYADCLGLKLMEIDGSNTYLEDLLTGPWDKQRFFVFGPGHQIGDVELIL